MYRTGSATFAGGIIPAGTGRRGSVTSRKMMPAETTYGSDSSIRMVAMPLATMA